MNSNQITKKAKQASLEIAHLNSALKNQILLKIADNLRKNAKEILAINQNEVAAAKQNSLPEAKIERLILNEARINSLADAIVAIANLPDPIDRILYQATMPSGINIKRVSVPIGVILAIYESRPGVTSDIAALCFKSGNSVILRCGKESFLTSKRIAEIYQNTLTEFNINPNCVSYVENSDYNYVKELLKMDKLIDVVIPRGGKELIKAVMKSSKIAVFKHLEGNCHTYIESEADLQKAVKIVLNAKMRRVGICGATESLLVDAKIASQFIPIIAKALNEAGCEIRGDLTSRKIAQNSNATIKITAATNQDFYTEYLDKIISLKVVKNIDEAIKHINQHGSAHTESIVSENPKKAEKFLLEVNSAIVMHNASTQFADGGEFGLGAEVGIATGKLHARGPVGLEQLATYKYIVEANCALRG